MKKHLLVGSLAISAALILAACSDNNESEPDNNVENSENAEDNGENSSTSELNPDAEPAVDDGQGGGDTTAIAGLWDGTTTEGEISDEVYWHLSEDGVLTRYDFQGDGVETANGENCYLVGDPISVTPEDENTYSFFNVATTVVRSDDTLTITFLDADINDLDNDGDTEEMPTLTWTLLETPLVEDLNACTEDETTTVENTDEGTTTETDASQAEDEDSGSSAETDPADSPTQTSPPAPPADTLEPSDSDADGSDIPFDNTDGRRPLMTRAECTGIGGTIIGDIGDGAIHRPEYRCESGEEPVARITYLEGEPIATDGEVCCL